MAIATTNPATGKVVRTFPALTVPELETKLALAASAFAQHRLTSFADRAKKMLRAAEILESDADKYAVLMTLEMGKPLAQAKAEALKCATACRYYAEKAEHLVADEPVPDAEGHCFVRYEPIGPVLAVMPWNFPFWQVVRFVAPALMAGNVGLLKHASNVPQCGFALEELFLRAGFPAGCFQYLAIESPAVTKVIEDSRVMAVTLTGSVGAGSKVAAVAGREIKRTVLELGGSDPFIVMPSAPLAKTVEQAVKGRVQNNGQSCVASKRFIVHTAVYYEFEKLFAEAFRKLRMGDPTQAETDIGPLAQKQGVDDIEHLVQQALASGGRALVGGKRGTGPGFFYEPTILVDIPVVAPIVREEFFGPVALLFCVRDLDEALALANSTSFGLGASIWTQDEAEQQRGIRELQAGQVFVNSIVASQPALPFGGIRQSGYGRELGGAGIREFMNAKSVQIAG